MTQNNLAHEILKHYRFGNLCCLGKVLIEFVFVESWRANYYGLDSPKKFLATVAIFVVWGKMNLERRNYFTVKLLEAVVFFAKLHVLGN